MYALIYDERDPSRPLKEVLSVHKRRDTAEKALQRRMKQLGKRVWECHARIVWTDKRVRPKDLMAPKDFSTWRPGERLPVGNAIRTRIDRLPGGPYADAAEQTGINPR